MNLSASACVTLGKIWC